jgi:hypothetical protein
MVSEALFPEYVLKDKFRSFAEADGCRSKQKSANTTEMRMAEDFRGIMSIVYIKI